MDVRLPNGTMLRGVPDDTSKDIIRERAIAGGYATEADFGSIGSEESQLDEGMSAYHPPESEFPIMAPTQAVEAEEKRQEMLRVPGIAPDAPIGKETRGRGGLIGISAMAGAEIGRRSAGPDPRMQLAGAAAGGFIGAFAGSYGYDRATGVPAHEAALTALREGELDASFSVGIPILANYAKVLGPAFIWAAGIDPGQAKNLLNTAAEIEAKFGIVDAATNAAVKGTRTVLGVFPWIGTPFRKASKQSAEAIEQTIERKLNQVAPNATLSQLGIDMARGAKNAYSEWKEIAGGLFDSADDYARATGATVPSKDIVEQAKTIGRRADFPELTEGGFKDAGGTAVTEYIESATKIVNERLTIDELRALEKGADELFTPEIAAIDARRLMLFKEGIEKAWSKIGTGTAGVDDPAVKEMYDFAKEFYADGMAKFSTVTAKKLLRIDKKMFRPGAFKAGTIDEDEVARVVLNLKSPKAVRDLKALVGDAPVQRAFRNKIETAIESATVKNAEGVVESFKWESLQKSLGLTGDKVEEEALQEILKGTGVNINDFYKVIELGMKLEGAPNASKFIARRATLGGKGALVTAFGGGALIGGGVGFIGTLLPITMARYGATLLTRPSTLKALLTTLDPAVKPALRRIAYARLIKIEMESEEQ